MQSSDFSKHLTRFLSHYLPEERNLSHNTVSSYCDTFRLLLLFCKNEKHLSIERLQIEDIKPDIIKDFLLWLENDRKCGISTRNQRLAAVHSFMKYLQSESPQNIFYCQKILALPYKKKSKPVITYLTADEMKIILSMPDLSTEEGRRNAALLSLLYDTGSRVQEVADLRAMDLHLSFPEKVIVTGKGRKSREVPLMSGTVKLLKSYMEEHEACFSQNMKAPLFQNRFNEKFTRAGIAYIHDKYAKQAKNILPTIPSSVTPHMLRHTKAMHLLQADIPIIYIRDFLGHVDISTTDIYARANVEMKRKVLEQASGSFSLEMPPWRKDSDILSWLKTLSAPIK